MFTKSLSIYSQTDQSVGYSQLSPVDSLPRTASGPLWRFHPEVVSRRRYEMQEGYVFTTGVEAGVLFIDFRKLKQKMEGVVNLMKVAVSCADSRAIKPDIDCI